MSNSKQITSLAITIVCFAFIFLAGCPVYHVWTERKNGEAALAHAQYSKEVQVAESKAEYESSAWKAGADTTRAHGVARSNEIIGQSLNRNEAYLRWLWIQNIDKNPNVMYIATEAGLPVTEAGRIGEMRYKKDSLAASGRRSN